MDPTGLKIETLIEFRSKQNKNVKFYLKNVKKLKIAMGKFKISFLSRIRITLVLLKSKCVALNAIRVAFHWSESHLRPTPLGMLLLCPKSIQGFVLYPLKLQFSLNPWLWNRRIPLKSLLLVRPHMGWRKVLSLATYKGPTVQSGWAIIRFLYL